MAENEQRPEVSTTGSTQTGVGTPSKRAVQMIDEMKKPTKPLPILKKNWAWPFFILVMGFIVGIAVGSMQDGIVSDNSTAASRVGFLIAVFFLGSLLGVIVYNIGKTIGAYLAGYRLSYLCISGVCWDASRPAKRLYFDGSQFLEIHSRYAPKDDDLNRNPIAMFLGGFAFWAIVFAVVMAVAFTAVSSQSIVRSGMIWGAAFSGDYIIYQLCPFRQDYAADMFSLVSTRNAEDRRAFNLYYYNRGNEFADREMLVPDFTAYDSYWKAKTMIYLFRSHLYTKGEIDQALETFPRIHEVSAYLNDEEKAQVAGERIFVLLLLNDRAGADNLFIELSKTVKGEVIRGNNLGSMRTALLVSGAIVGREDTTVDNVKSMKALMVKNPTSHKLQTEQSYYRLAYAKVKEIKPGFNLPALPEAAEQN